MARRRVDRGTTRSSSPSRGVGAVTRGSAPDDIDDSATERPPQQPTGRDEGFELLYRREYDAMMRLALLLVGRDEPAQDAVHDAFATVYERWDSIERHGGYLRTTVVNRCRDTQRRRFLDRTRAAALEPRTTTDLGARELLDALDKLPAKRRAALVLRYYLDLSDADVAATLGVPEGTAKSMASRGLAELRRVVLP